MKLGTILSTAALLALPALAAEEGAAPNKFGQDFLKHWTIARQLTTAVAEAMPAESYDFKPNPEEMSFGEQMVHIASANYSYCSRIGGGKSPFTKPEKSDKPTALKALDDSFGFCADAVQGAKDLDVMRGPMSVRETMLGAYAHMAHHRGQAEVYLRVKGIKPPAYKF